MGLQIDHYAIYCIDLESSIKFYKEIMGFKDIKRPDFEFPGYWFDVGKGQQLHLISGRNVSEGDLPNTRNIHYAFKSSDINKFNNHLDLHKIPKIGPKKRPDGITQIFIQDPNGYWIEITE
ncbi:MAG TPA: VOC family protein [Cytophagales bacterium]|nr:VOC family protein [Cytophagales bacterium]